MSAEESEVDAMSRWSTRSGREAPADMGEDAVEFRGRVDEEIRGKFPSTLSYKSASSSSNSWTSPSEYSMTTSAATSPMSMQHFPLGQSCDRDLSKIIELSKLRLPAPSLPISLKGSVSGQSTPMNIPEPERPDAISSAASNSTAPSSTTNSPLATPSFDRRSMSMSSDASPAPGSPLSECDAGRPPNFGIVAPGAYRSSFPKPEHFPFLRSLGLKTILLLVIEPYPDVNRQFATEEGVEVIQLGMPNNKDPNAQIPAETIRKALSVILDKRKHPLLVHCNRGKHRTGCVVGCLRKLQRWSNEAAMQEYLDYSAPKQRISDQRFIEAFTAEQLWQELAVEHIPSWNIVAPWDLAECDRDTTITCEAGDPVAGRRFPHPSDGQPKVKAPRDRPATPTDAG